MAENLPISAESHDQERLSVLKFELIVPADKFIVRGETGGDYGVDRILELKTNAKFLTNYRSSIQLKSVQESKRNQDGSFSYPVSIDTLNYLMNQPNSIFAIYLVDEDVFLWAWVSDIFNFAKSKGIDIQDTDQQTISFRFTQQLDHESFDEIYSKIINSCEVLRKLTEITNSTTNSIEINSAILIKDGKVTNIGELSEQLKVGGVALVNAGNIGLINEIIDTKLPLDAKRDANLALVCAYAKYNAGAILDALALLPRGQDKLNLTESNKYLSEYLSLSINYSMNLINKQQYLDGLLAIENTNPNSLISLQIKLERQRRLLFSKRISESKDILSEIEATTRQLKESSGVNETTKLRTDIVTWEIEGYRINSLFLDRVFKYKIRDNAGFHSSLSERLNDATDLIQLKKNWHDKYSVLREKSSINPICLGELITIFALIELQFISTSQSISGKANDGDEELLTVIYGELESAVKLLMEYGAHQTGLRAKLLQADALEGLNKCDESRKLVDEVLAIAEQIGATDLVSIAKQYVAGETIFNMKRQLANSIPNSHFDIVRNLSDNEINDMARDILEAFNLPADRIKYIVKDLFWDRDDANEITSYCRHMLTKQDITHTLKPDTLYAYDPPRIIECGLLGYRSPQSGSDRTFLINEFKRSFCHMCKRKEI
jgi:hypothetical protein